MDLEPLFTVAAWGNAAIGVFLLGKGFWNLAMAETVQAQMEQSNKTTKNCRMRYKRYFAGSVGCAINSALFFSLG